MIVTFETLDYAGMYAAEFAAWLVLLALAGYLSRAVLGGPKPLGLFGDLVVATVGLFGLGYLLERFGISAQNVIAPYLSATVPGQFITWIALFLVGLGGALILRVPLRILGGRG